uniref:HGWP repeat containing protein-like n=1 Tax=Oryza sativa subsp. japonica TaxID=39947 RepID=Q6EPK2_ORYSJ|nr:HGWP repeat containing protein-like [Oryza sativa Japonica Group]
MAAGPPAPIPSPPAILSPFQPHLNPPRTSFARFHPLPRLLLAGIELAPSLSLSSIADDLRPALSARRDCLPPRRRLLRLRRTTVDPIHPSSSSPTAGAPPSPFTRAASPPSSAPAAFFVLAVDLGGAGAPPPAGRADVAAFGRAERLPHAAASEDPLFVEVEADVWESEQGKSHHL